MQHLLDLEFEQYKRIENDKQIIYRLPLSVSISFDREQIKKLIADGIFKEAEFIMTTGNNYYEIIITK